MNETEPTTTDYNGLQNLELTITQLNAIDQLLMGKNDRETAELLGIHRVTVTNWRLYHQGFRAELKQRREEIWSGVLDRVRSSIPKALDLLVSKLQDPSNYTDMKAASAILRMIPIRTVVPVDPTEPEDEVVPQKTEAAG